jgi:hypothetical protein
MRPTISSVHARVLFTHFEWRRFLAGSDVFARTSKEAVASEDRFRTDRVTDQLPGYVVETTLSNVDLRNRNHSPCSTFRSRCPLVRSGAGRAVRRRDRFSVRRRASALVERPHAVWSRPRVRRDTSGLRRIAASGRAGRSRSSCHIAGPSYCTCDARRAAADGCARPGAGSLGALGRERLDNRAARDLTQDNRTADDDLI